MRDGVRRRARLRLASAFSTLVQEVFWVRIAPTITSNGVFAGHQPMGPRAAERVWKYSRNVEDVVWLLPAVRVVLGGRLAKGVALTMINRPKSVQGTIAGEATVVKAGCG
jgi:hypothetical protein